jgi:uncharacterized OB-fold protein
VGAVQSTFTEPGESESQKEETGISVTDFQAAALRGIIIGYECERCKHKQIDLLAFCPKCGHRDLQKTEFIGEGNIVTYTIQYVAPEGYINQVPYAWVVVRLKEGVNATGWIPSIKSGGDLKLGQKVRVRPYDKPGLMFEKV